MAQQRRPAGNRKAQAPRQPGAGDDLAPRRARLRAIIAPVVGEAGYDLEALSLSRVGRRHLVRVIVDGDDGVTLDTVAELSRDISAALDKAEESGDQVVSGEYELEVSSPGVDRPLTLPRHWRRNIGRLVKVTVVDRGLLGRVLTADEAGVQFDVDGARHRVAYDELGPGRVQVEFNRLDQIDDDVDDLIDDEEGDDEA